MDLSDIGGSVIRSALCLITDPSSQKYPKPFVSPSLAWLAWLDLASLASAWLVSSAAATTTATTPEQAYITIGAALRAAAMVVDACSGVVAVVVAAADETSHAEARRAKPSQASQSREGLTNGFGYLRDEPWVRQSTHNWLWIWIYPVCDCTLY